MNIYVYMYVAAFLHASHKYYGVQFCFVFVRLSVLLCMCVGSLVSIVLTNAAWGFIVSYIFVGVLMCCSGIV